MHPLENFYKNESHLVIGLMSGTSADGIDAALCRITGAGTETKVEQLDFLFTPFEEEVRNKILSIAGGESCNAEEICKLKTLLGILYSDACKALCAHAGISVAQIDLVGNHGQTVWHIPRPTQYLGHTFASTLQISEDAEIAEAMGCPVVGDFRVRDVAAKGQGAPLVPYTEFLLYRSDKETVALQNIGGIGNITILPKDCTLDQVTAFDTGPGNMVMDAIVSRITNGRMGYDDKGEMAAKGQVSKELLDYMLDDPYLSKPLPKTTGREMYGPLYVDKLFEKAEELGIKDYDILATATRFTAEAIRIGIEKFAPVKPSRLVVGGGGSHNPTLLGFLQDLLPECKILTGEDMGYSSDAKEAVAFAILAHEAMYGNSNNVPSVTGADKPVVMGKLSI